MKNNTDNSTFFPRLLILFYQCVLQKYITDDTGIRLRYTFVQMNACV